MDAGNHGSLFAYCTQGCPGERRRLKRCVDIERVLYDDGSHTMAVWTVSQAERYRQNGDQISYEGAVSVSIPTLPRKVS